MVANQSDDNNGCFSILKYLAELTPDDGSQGHGEGSYHCPVCNAPNFKIVLETGIYSTFGCDCAATEAGKRKIRHALCPAKKPKKQAANKALRQIAKPTTKESTPTTESPEEIERWAKPTRAKADRTFEYSKADGSPLARVVRRDDGTGKRQFFQQHWDGEGWSAGFPESLRDHCHLYRIFAPINQSAIAGGKPLLIVEGEGNVDALHTLGIAATTAIGGAGKWAKYGHVNYAADLAGAQAVIVPDRDKPGIKHGGEIAEELPEAQWLYPEPESPEWAELPTSGGFDIADWIAQGATAEQILEAIGEQQDRQPAKAKLAPAKETGEAVDLPIEKSRYTKRFEAVQAVYSDRLRFNQLSKKLKLDGTELDLDSLQHDLSVTYQIDVPDCHIARILNAIGKENAYHPVVQYLEQVAIAQGPDTSILNDLATRYFGTTNPLHNSYLRKTLIAAVARATSPGCKVDTALILQGPQGYLKSTFFEVISNGWFEDTFRDVTDKDDLLKMHSAWFVEWAELENVFGKRDVSLVKAFLSTKKEPIRTPYARQPQTYQRASIIVGSTNQDEFLSDATGARRYWVIPVSQRIDIEALKQERDQIWAAAVAAYRASEPWWLTDSEEKESAEFVGAYTSRDPWEDAIAAYVRLLPAVTTLEILERCLKVDLPKMARGDEMRVSRILKQIGWSSDRAYKDGRRIRVWLAPDTLVQPEVSPDPALEPATVPVESDQEQDSGLQMDLTDWGEPTQRDKNLARTWRPEPGQQVGQAQQPTRLGLLVSRTERQAKVLWSDTGRETIVRIDELCEWYSESA